MKIEREIRRKAFHIMAGMSIPVLYYVFMVLEQTWLATWILLAITLSILAIDVIRLRHQFIKIIFIDFFGPMMRRHEISALTGATYLMISSLLCVLIYSDSVAIAAISFLVIGDALAAIVGRSVGRIKFFEKSFEGAGAGLLGCLLVGALIVNLPASDLKYLQMAVGALTAIVVEMLPIPLDDNIRIPLASGAVMHLLF